MYGMITISLLFLIYFDCIMISNLVITYRTNALKIGYSRLEAVVDTERKVVGTKVKSYITLKKELNLI